MVLVTGSAGFIGFHLSLALLKDGLEVVGVDNINEYYDPKLKETRLNILLKYKNFKFYRIDICDFGKLKEVFKENNIKKVCHLAAQAGVRYSIDHPFEYQKSNNEGFLNVLECARHNNINNFVFASSSSVYGDNKKLPFKETDRTDTPISLYAATKKANEVTAYSYSKIYNIPCSGLRFFTVYGPWGRPDMALFLFTKAMLNGDKIDVYNNGQMKRNFTYIDDIVHGIRLVLDNPTTFNVYNIANNETVTLLSFIQIIEEILNKKANMNMLPMQLGDVPETRADITKLMSLGYIPSTNIRDGIKNFIEWYIKNY